MTEYLSGYFAPHLIPKRYKAGQEGKIGGETEEYLRYVQLMHYAEGSLMAVLVVGLVMNGKCITCQKLCMTDLKQKFVTHRVCLSS